MINSEGRKSDYWHGMDPFVRLCTGEFYPWRPTGMQELLYRELFAQPPCTSLVLEAPKSIVLVKGK